MIVAISLWQLLAAACIYLFGCLLIALSVLRVAHVWHAILTSSRKQQDLLQQLERIASQRLSADAAREVRH